MPTINQLPVLSTISSGDQLPVYSPNNGDARRTSIGSLLTFFQQSFASPTLSVNLYVPGSGFNITVPTPVSNDQWMLLQPAGTLATGTVTLPLNTGVPDGTTVLITTTQEITSFTIALNGASAIYGPVTSLAAGTGTQIRFYQPTNSWYQINADTVYAAGMQTFLASPSSANLRAAMTDETGTGLLVFNTSPTLVTPILGTVTSGNISACTSTSMVLVTPILGTPTSGTLTNCTGLPIATGVSGLAANVATFLATPTSANLAAALTDETGTGANVFATSPTIATPNITNPSVSTGTFTNPTVSTGTFTSPTLVTPAIGVATGTSLVATGTIVSSGTAGVGYSTGAGGTVIQGTSRTTGVTLNKTTGAITLFSAAGTTTAATFTVTNSTVAATDVIILNQKSGTDLYDLMVTAVAAGSFNLTFRTTGGTTTETPVFNFAVIKGVAA
jgi:hypothetical protein